MSHPGLSEAEIIGESALRYAVLDQSSSSPAPVLVGSYRERLLNYLVARMRSSLELQTILDTAVQELCSVLGADRTVIYRFDKGGRGQVVSESLPESTTSVLGRVGSDNCFPQDYAWRYRNGRVRAIADVQNAELQKARWAAEESSRLKSAFLATISHELRTPLNGIIGTMELVRSECEGNPDQWDLLTMGLSSADELLRLVSNILDMSKIESGPIVLTCEQVHLERVVKEVAALFENQARQKCIELIVDVPSMLRVHADEQRLRQVLTNVIGNAVKFTHTGYVTMRAMPYVQTKYLNLEIQDTGIGIAPEHQSHLFKSFVQVDGSSKRRYGGSGLGLAISRELIEQMGGQIRLSSSGASTGTCVSIVLPEVDTHAT